MDAVTLGVFGGFQARGGVGYGPVMEGISTQLPLTLLRKACGELGDIDDGSLVCAFSDRFLFGSGRHLEHYSPLFNRNNF